MILDPGIWHGRGYWREVSASTGIRFDVAVVISDTREGIDIKATATTATEHRLELQVWIVPDDAGQYVVNVRGDGIDMTGIAKLESLPHLALLSSDDNRTHVAATVFELPEVHGARGFHRTGEDMFTFEIALQPRSETVKGDNILYFPVNRQRR